MKKKSVPTMGDVALAARCSRAAVSLALRGDRSIPEKTRLRIVGIARKLGYRTNPLVSALMSLQRQGRSVGETTSVIAYLTTHGSDNSWRRHSPYVGMYNGALARGVELGYRVEEFDLGAPGMTAARLRQILEARGIHGVVVAPLPHRSTSLDFDFSSLAVVGLGMSVHEPVIERVANDHFQSAALCVARCVALGYQRIGLVLSHETSLRLDHRWLGGYRFAVEHHGQGQRVPPLMTERSDDLPDLIPAWQREHKPDVVILDNSYAAYVDRLPARTGVVSLSVDSLESPVSGIFQDYPNLGRVAVERVAAKLYANSFGLLPEAQLHLVAGVWVQGASTPGPGKLRPAAGA